MFGDLKFITSGGLKEKGGSSFLVILVVFVFVYFDFFRARMTLIDGGIHYWELSSDVGSEVVGLGQ